MTLCIGRFPICAAIYMFIPSGGVTMPIDVAVTIMAPKCTRDTPYCSAMGDKIGARTITAGDASTKQPVISMMITTQIRNTILLLLKLSIALAAMLATCSRLSTNENAQELATISIIFPVLFIALPRASIIVLKLSS